jgi:hypothetical protein
MPCVNNLWCNSSRRSDCRRTVNATLSDLMRLGIVEEVPAPAGAHIVTEIP